MAPLTARSDEDPHFPAPEEGSFVLLVDDEPLILRSLKRILERVGYEIALAESVAEAERYLTDPRLDVVLVDLLLGPVSGLELLEKIKSMRPEVEVIVMTGHGSIESAVGCIRRGAFDYLEKPFDDLHRIQTTVRKAIDRRSLVRRNSQLEDELRSRSSIPEFVGKSPAMRALANKIHSLRHNESHVLIQGESGTGKELVAYAVHSSSPRASGDFVPVDCGALPETIIESELFGHEKGAFTGATEERPGKFEAANGGTLFLDEIGNTSPEFQQNILRAIEYQEIQRVGSAHPLTVDVRIITATNANLEEEISAGRFRQDLYDRLRFEVIRIPPLRERPEDIPPLADHFVHQILEEVPGLEEREFSDRARAAMMHYTWPGNVRELKFAAERAACVARGPRLEVEDLPPEVAGGGQATSEPDRQGFEAELEGFELNLLRRSLAAANWNQRKAAESLELSYDQFRHFYRKHHLSREKPE